MHRSPVCVTYFVSAPHPPSERRTDAGQLPPWLLGVAFSPAGMPHGLPSGSGSRVESVNSPEPDSADSAGPDSASASAAVAPVCSAKGCRADAVWVLAWNNPKLHTPERRKTWLACDDHREHLSSFLGVRGFLKDVVTLAEWESRDSPPA